VIVGEYVGDYGCLGNRLGKKHWLARVKKSGFLQKLFGNTLGRGLYSRYSPDFPPAVKVHKVIQFRK
jgi:hypothetical protein